MDVHEALYAQLLAKYTADTGADGLNNSASPALVRHFVRMGDPSIGEELTGNWPKVIVEIMDADASSFEHRYAKMIVRLHIYTERNQGFTPMNAINKQVAVLLDKVALGAATSPWTFNNITRLRSFRAPETPTEMHYVHEFQVSGYR
jgi:hypothetical protein